MRLFVSLAHKENFVVRPSSSKIVRESPMFLQRAQGDVCGAIHIPRRPLQSHVCLLSTCNIAFARYIAQIMRLKAQFADYPIKIIRLDNVDEFTYKTFDDYCTSIRVDIEHPVPHVHLQNGLNESLIKQLQIITRTLLIRVKLPISAWGHAILHVVMLFYMLWVLVRFRPTAYHQYSLTQLVLSQQLNISYLRIFCCVVYVLISPPHCTKMGKVFNVVWEFMLVLTHL